MDYNTLIGCGAAAIIIGFLLDLLLGDPRRLPHPIRLFGLGISKLEKTWNRGENRVAKGVLMWATLIALTGVVFAFLGYILKPYPCAASIFSAIFFFYGISNRSLIQEALKVEKRLKSGDIEGARAELSMIVGRDTKHLNETQIRVAVLETLSENLSDGVIAPMFYYAIGGVPCIMIYKMINTLDSMVGYKNDRFRQFGYFSAKMDDIANFIPSRLTALLIALVALSPRAIKFIFRYGRSHSSPNSGYPEAALAGVLNCRFGGESQYQGVIVPKPYIGSNSREVTHKDITKACTINMLVATISIVILICLRLMADHLQC